MHYEIKEGDKARRQFFKGVVIQRRGESIYGALFTIHKMSGNVNVECILRYLS